jgi:3-phenylpropionate/cinnamic acid dioxygenase small subunit
MTDREEICQIMSRYCWHVDHLEWNEWLDLFTQDASWRAGEFGPFEGREAMTKLTRSLEKLVLARKARHFVACEIVDIDGEAARLRTYIMVVAAATQKMTTLGEYEISVAKRDGRWRIRKLEFTRIEAPATDAAGAA